MLNINHELISHITTNVTELTVESNSDFTAASNLTFT